MQTRYAYIILAFILLVTGQQASAQKPDIGISAGIGRSFVYTQNLSSKTSNQDYIHADGNLQYMVGARLEAYLNKKSKVSLRTSYIKNKTDYTLYEIEPNKFQITRNWLGTQDKFDVLTGLSYDILSMKYSKLVFNVGISDGILFQRIKAVGLQFSSQGYSTGTYDITTENYYSYQKQRWQTTIESGLGWRLEPKLDINLLYSFGLTSSAPLEYTYKTTFSGTNRESSGTIKGRPNYIAVESVFWLNR